MVLEEKEGILELFLPCVDEVRRQLSARLAGQEESPNRGTQSAIL